MAMRQAGADEIDVLRRLNADLNPEQRLAAETTEGPVILVAGAGAGKTKVLIHRVATLIAKKVPATEIMVVTFTNRAASEIKDRLEAMVGESAQYVTAGTFHSIIYREVLRPNAHSSYLAGLGIDMTECAILDQDDSGSLMKAALRSLGESDKELVDENEWTVAHFEKEMTSIRSQGTPLPEYRARIKDGSDGAVFKTLASRVWQAYNTYCRAAKGIDFDDILVFAAQMLEREPALAVQLGERFKYLMLDEYQDTNPVQMRIMDAIAQAHQNVCVVGDEKQSIYRFRGSDIRVILGFKERYPQAKQIEMIKNYRSLGRVIEMCNACAQAMTQRLSDGQLIAMRDLSPQHPSGLMNKATLVEFPEDRDEARMVAAAIHRDLHMGKRGDSIAVLYRNREDKGELERALWERQISCHVVGDASFFKRTEVRDAIALIRFVFQPWDSAAGLRIIRSANLGVSEERAKKAMGKERISVTAFLEIEAAKTLGSGKKGPDGRPVLSRSATKISALRRLCELIRESYAAGDSPGIIKEMLAEAWDIYLLPALRRISSSAPSGGGYTLESRVSNATHVFERFQHEIEQEKPLDEIVEDFTMMVEGGAEAEANLESKVRLMTIHASKGAEFDCVYVIAADSKSLPGETDDLDDIEEARRVMYVAMTRAREKLAVSYSRQKYFRGQVVECSPSPFLSEVALTLGIAPLALGEKREADAISVAEAHECTG